MDTGEINSRPIVKTHDFNGEPLLNGGKQVEQVPSTLEALALSVRDSEDWVHLNGIE